jgi:hypothetical protein
VVEAEGLEVELEEPADTSLRRLGVVVVTKRDELEALARIVVRRSEQKSTRRSRSSRNE